MLKTKLLVAIPLTALSIAAYADGGNVGVRVYDGAARSGTGLTRAQVRAELDAALARGEPLRFGEASPGPLADAQPSTRTRAEVRAELDAALARGEPLRFGEASSGPLADAQPSTRTRAEVRAELLEAIRLGVRGDGGEAGPTITTPEQEAQITAAGRAAARKYAATVR